MRDVVKVTRNYQVTIPVDVRDRLGVRGGDLVRIVYDEQEGVAKIIPVRKRRITIKLGREVSVEEVERLVEEALDEATS